MIGCNILNIEKVLSLSQLMSHDAICFIKYVVELVTLDCLDPMSKEQYGSISFKKGINLEIKNKSSNTREKG